MAGSHRIGCAICPSSIIHSSKTWAGAETAKKCVARELKWEHFGRRRNQCRVHEGVQCQSVARGDFIYFDHFHGTDALYRQAARLYIDEIEILMNTRETLVGMNAEGFGQRPTLSLCVLAFTSTPPPALRSCPEPGVFVRPTSNI